MCLNPGCHYKGIDRADGFCCDACKNCVEELRYAGKQRAQTEEVPELGVALKKLSLKAGDVLIIQTEGGVEPQVLSRIKAAMQRQDPEMMKRICIMGIGNEDTIMVASEGTVTST